MVRVGVRGLNTILQARQTFQVQVALSQCFFSHSSAHFGQGVWTTDEAMVDIPFEN
jgi:hypothetical protein